MWTSHGGGRMEYGRGQYLYDDLGAQYLDCINSTAQVGHCDAGVLAAACMELGQLLPDATPQASHGEFERLLSNTLPAHLNTFFHCDSGTQAVDLAIRLSRLWCGRKASKLNRSDATGVPFSSATRGGENSEGTFNSKGRRKSDPGTSTEPFESEKSIHCSPCGDSVNDDIERCLARLSSPSSLDSGAASSSDASISVAHNPSSEIPLENRSTNAQKRCLSPHEASEIGISQTLHQSSLLFHEPGSSKKSRLSKVEKRRTSDAGGCRRVACGDVVVVEGSFHGCTDSVVKLSSRMSSRSQSPQNSSTYSVHVVPLLDVYRARSSSTAALQCPYDPVEAIVQRHLAECRLIMQRATDSGRRLACLLVEPHLTIQGGQHPPAAWLQGLYSLVREYGGLCVSDEVQSGLGRLGDTVWGFESQGVTPDIVIIAKGIGNGLPMAVTVTTAEIAATLGPLRSAYKCKSLQNAVGAAVLHSLHQGGLMHSAATTGRYLGLLLLKLQEKHPYVGDVRGRGLLQVIDIVWSREQRVPSAQIADFLVHKLRRVGVVIAREGVHKNVLVVMPPMTFDVLDAASLVTKLDEALSIVPNTFGLDQPVNVRIRRPVALPQNELFSFLDVTRPRMMGATYADVTFESYLSRDSFESPLRSGASHFVTQCHHEVNQACSCHRHSELRFSTLKDASHRRESSTSSTSVSHSDNTSLRSSTDLYSLSSCKMAPISHTSVEPGYRSLNKPSESTPTTHRSVQTTSSFYVGSDSKSPYSSPRDVSEVQTSMRETSSDINPRHASRIDATARSSAPTSLSKSSVQTLTECSTAEDGSSKSHALRKRKDVFSNIILVEKDISPGYNNIDSAMGTFVSRQSQHLTPPSPALHSRGEISGSSSIKRPENKDLHPNELPRTCEPLGTGLGMVQPVPARTAPPSPRVAYEDVD